MKTILKVLKSLFRDEDGQTLVEYAWIVFLVGVAAVAALTLLGTNITAIYNAMAAAI